MDSSIHKSRIFFYPIEKTIVGQVHELPDGDEQNTITSDAKR
jgi:hypothetical protein